MRFHSIVKVIYTAEALLRHVTFKAQNKNNPFNLERQHSLCHLFNFCERVKVPLSLFPSQAFSRTTTRQFLLFWFYFLSCDHWHINIHRHVQFPVRRLFVVATERKDS